MHKDHYPFFERIFYRPIASVLTLRLAEYHCSPTLMNFIGFFTGLGGMVLIAFGDYPLRVLGAGILIVSYIFDCVDGQLARGFRVTNGFGALLDTTLDSIKESLIMFALSYVYFKQTQNEYIEIYLVIIIFLQRMFGRTLAWYRLLFHRDIEVIKKNAYNTLSHLPIFLRWISLFFSEAYRSGTIWFVVFSGILTNQIIATLIYFIVVIAALFLFLLISAYRDKKVRHVAFPTEGEV